MSEFFIGVDLGGTFTKLAVLEIGRAGKRVYGFSDYPTPTSSPEELIDAVVQGASNLMTKLDLDPAECRGVGIGAPGPLNRRDGVILNLPNIPGMANLKLRDRVGEGLGLPAILENDANAAALGEYLFGAGRDVRSMIMLTLGTGVGGGIVVNGEIFHGAHDIAGEVGHMIVQPGGRLCNCGQRGCLEQYASATFLAKNAADEIAKGRESILKAVLDEKGSIDAADVNAARKQGDELAAEAWDCSMKHLALACVSLERLFDCELIVLAGGLTKAGDDLLKPLRAHYDQFDWKLSPHQSEIAIADLGSGAGVYGAASVAWQAYGSA